MSSSSIVHSKLNIVAMVLAYGLLTSEPTLRTGWAINIALSLIIQPAESLVLLDAVPFFLLYLIDITTMSQPNNAAKLFVRSHWQE